MDDFEREYRATFAPGNTGWKAEGTGTPPTNVFVDAALAVTALTAAMVSRLARRLWP